MTKDFRNDNARRVAGKGLRELNLYWTETAVTISRSTPIVQSSHASPAPSYSFKGHCTSLNCVLRQYWQVLQRILPFNTQLPVLLAALVAACIHGGESRSKLQTKKCTIQYPPNRTNKQYSIVSCILFSQLCDRQSDFLFSHTRSNARPM